MGDGAIRGRSGVFSPGSRRGSSKYGGAAAKAKIMPGLAGGRYYPKIVIDFTMSIKPRPVVAETVISSKNARDHRSRLSIKLWPKKDHVRKFRRSWRSSTPTTAPAANRV